MGRGNSQRKKESTNAATIWDWSERGEEPKQAAQPPLPPSPAAAGAATAAPRVAAAAPC